MGDILKNISENTKCILFVLLGSCSFGTLSFIVKNAYIFGVSSEYLTFSQFFYGWILCILSLILFNKNFIQVNLGIKNIVNLCFIGFFSYIGSYFYNETLTELPASLAIVLLFQYTWICILLDSLFMRVKVKKKIILGVLFLFIGTILSSGILFNLNNYNYSFKGYLFGLLSALSYSLFLYFNKNQSIYIDPLIKNFLIISIASLFSIIGLYKSFSINFFINNFTYLFYNNKIFYYLFFGLLMGLFGSLIPTFFITYGSQKLSISLSSILSSVELPIVILLSYFLLHEYIFPLQFIGVFLIIFGIIISQADPQQLKSNMSILFKRLKKR